MILTRPSRISASRWAPTTPPLRLSVATKLMCSSPASPESITTVGIPACLASATGLRKPVRSSGAMTMPSTRGEIMSSTAAICWERSSSLCGPFQTISTSSSWEALMAPAWIDFQYSCVVPMGMTAMDNLPSLGPVGGPQAVNSMRHRRAPMTGPRKRGRMIAKETGLVFIFRPIVANSGRTDEPALGSRLLTMVTRYTGTIARATEVCGSLLGRHRIQEFGVGGGLAHLVEKQLHGIDGRHLAQYLAQHPDAVELFFR